MLLTVLTGIGAFFLAGIHFFTKKLKLSYIPRSKILSIAGGISIAYIFVYMLPELTEWQEKFAEQATSEWVTFLEHHLYFISLLGLTFFYGLERAARSSQQSDRKNNEEEPPSNVNIFWVHILSFTAYNFLIGYLLVHGKEQEFSSLVFFIFAMGFHFLVNDYSLFDHHKQDYERSGRWIISAAIIVGWLVGILTQIQEVYMAVIFAFVAGGVIMNVLKEELPAQREGKFWFFILGVVTYSVLLIAL